MLYYCGFTAVGQIIIFKFVAHRKRSYRVAIVYDCDDADDNVNDGFNDAAATGAAAAAAVIVLMLQFWLIYCWLLIAVTLPQ